MEPARKFLRLVENRLGWVPTNIHARRVTERKVAEKVAANPSLYTYKNLALAVELLAREKEPRSPLGVFAHVERALTLARDDDTDLETKIQEAVRIEQRRLDPDGWVIRFARASGTWRADVYAEWLATRKKRRRS